MKKIILLVICIMSFSIMAMADDWYYSMKLINVEVSNGNKGEFSAEKTRFGIDFGHYKDDAIEISITIHPNHVSFDLTNNTASQIKIIWDDAVFSGFDNSSIGVFHYGTKFAKREETQVPSTILKGTKLSDVIVPKNMINFNRPLKGSGWWEIRSFLTGTKKVNSRTIKLLLPIEIGGEKVDYIFTFEALAEVVKNVKTKTANDGRLYYREVIRYSKN